MRVPSSSLVELWSIYNKRILISALILNLLAGVYRLKAGFSALLWGWEDNLYTVALMQRFVEVQSWFEGLPVYTDVSSAVYPPASYLILWPFMGWLDFASVRLLWAMTAIPALGLFAWLCVTESKADTTLEKLFIASLAFVLYPTGMSIFVGQIVTHFLPFLLAGLILLKNSEGRLRYDLLASLMLVLSLVKPTISVPFFWIVLFFPRRLRPILLVLGGYAILTIVSASFQDAEILTLIRNWLVAAPNVGISQGHANFHKWLTAIGHKNLMMPVSLITLMVLGIWIYTYRKVHIWILIGVAALITHFWAHHRLYDDLVIVLPMISLFRIAKSSEHFKLNNNIAAFLFIGLWATLLFVPGRIISSPSFATFLIESLQVLIMAATLVFLLYEAWVDKKLAQEAQTESLTVSNPNI